MESNKFELNKADLTKVADGAVIAVVGALLTYGTTAITQINFGVSTPLVVALFGVLANLVRKLLQGELPVETPVSTPITQ